ncbi:MAG: AI-2E family transporter [Patescibacteria group bacterium]|nr:AI-2E family transporter [Patescibacteria group bacterium]
MNKIEISTNTLIRFFLILAGILVLYFIRDVLLLLFIAAIIVVALEPMVDWAENRKIPRAITTSFLYLVLLGIIALMFSLLIPPLVSQIANLANNLPYYITKITPIYNQIASYLPNWQQILENISQQLGNISGGIFSAGIVLFGGIFSTITILVISFYALIGKTRVNAFIASFFPTEKQTHVLQVIKQITEKIGHWFRSQILLSLIMGVLVSTVLYIMGIPYALTIGVIGAILEVIPFIGATLTGIIAVLFALIFGSWIKAILAVVAYIILQEIEAHFLVPKIMGKAVGLSPIIIIIALLIGGKIAGIVGALIAIPVAAAISILVIEFRKIKKN